MSLAVPDDVSAALRLTAGFDAVLTQGFARLTPARATVHSTLRAKSALRCSGAGRACALPSAE